MATHRFFSLKTCCVPMGQDTKMQFLATSPIGWNYSRELVIASLVACVLLWNVKSENLTSVHLCADMASLSRSH